MKILVAFSILNHLLTGCSNERDTPSVTDIVKHEVAVVCMPDLVFINRLG